MISGIKMNGITKTICYLLVVFGQEAAACKLGWFPGNGSCYYFSKDATNFFTALSFCKFYGGKLVEIDNWDEYHTLKRMVIHRSLPNFWIGLTDMFGEGEWVKATSLASQTFTMWYPGEPNNRNMNEHCAMWYSSYYQWNDYWCGEKLHFVCEQ